MATKPIAAPAVRTEHKGARFVSVLCKFPAGMKLQLCEARKEREETPLGPRERTTYYKVGKVYTVRGPGEPNGQAPKGYRRPLVVEGGYAVTPDIPKDFWDEWLDQNKDSPYVQNKIIMAEERGRDYVEGLSEDHGHVRSGFEPLKPDGDPRVPRASNPNIDGIKQAERD